MRVSRRAVRVRVDRASPEATLGPMSTPATAARVPGSQTLARGLDALRAVVDSREGLTPQELAARLDVHRTIAYRILLTLAEAGMVAKGADGRYRGGIGLFALAQGATSAFRQAALPIMRELADETGATASLLVGQGDEAIALAVVESSSATYRISFAEGSRHPITSGSAGLALRMLETSQVDPAADEALERARTLGYARTFGEVEPGAYGLATPVRRADAPPMCVNLITHREDLIEPAVPLLLRAAQRLADVEA